MAARILFFAYGCFAYALFFLTFLYAIAFVGGFAVPVVLDGPLTMPFATALLIDAFADAANVMMKPTSATPIIRAAAVDAVRFGVRMAFSRPRAPLTPPNRAIGQPITRATGRASTGANTATAMKITAAPRPTSATVPPLRPAAIEPMPAAKIPPPTTTLRREVAARSMATARIAATGGT